MEKSLILMRHAESCNDYLCDDFDRELTENGCEQAKRAGLFLKNYFINIDKVLCSPATRTYKTYQIISDIITLNKLELSKDIYDESKDDLYNLIISQDNNYNNVMLIGHNPTISELAFTLTSGKIDFEVFKPSTVVILVFSKLKSWRDICESNISDYYKYN